MLVVNDSLCQLRGLEVLRFFKENGQFNEIKGNQIILNMVTSNNLGSVYKSMGVERYNIARELRNMYDGKYKD